MGSCRPIQAHGSSLAIRLLLAGLLAGILLIVWRGVPDADFVLDDHPVIVEQEGHLLEDDPFERLFTAERPVTELTFLLDVRRFGMDPRGWHWTNLIIHLLGALVLAELVRRAARVVLDRSDTPLPRERVALGIGFAAGLLWGVHPVQTEVVSYVVQRSEALASLFCFLAMLALVLAHERGRNALALPVVLLATLLALGAKASAVCLPPMLLLLDWGMLAGGLRAALRRRWPIHLAAWLPASVFAGWLLIGGGLLDPDPREAVGVGLGVRGQSALTYLLAQIEAVPVYFGLVIWPDELLIDRPDRIGTWSTALIPGALLLVAWIGLASTALRSGGSRWWGALMLMSLVAMLPTSSLIPVTDVVVEHRLYLAVAPLAALVAGLGGGLLVVAAARTSPVRLVFAAWLPWLVLLLGFTVVLAGNRVHRRNLDYAEPERLWTQVLDSDNGSIRGLVNRSGALLRQGRAREALVGLEEVLARDPSNLQARINAGIALVELDQPVEALGHLEIAQQTFSGHPAMHAALGDVERALGNLESAEHHYGRVIERQPSDARTCLALANVLQEQGRLEDCLVWQDRAIGILLGNGDPDLLHSALMNRGSTSFRLERWADAADHYQQAIAVSSTPEQRERIDPYLRFALERLSATGSPEEEGS